ARAAGANLAIAHGARWLAMTDADTVVPTDWLAAQLDCGADAFCGVVGVADWRGHQAATRQAFERLESRQDGHAHVHGANLGVSAQAYTQVGGFPPLVSSEDVALVDALVAADKRIARCGAPAVLTSARRSARAPRGFSDYLLRLEAALLAQPGA
ncbi:glycosyltransferase family 2 protein, partial [Xanthomonas sp. Kuri4-2]